MTGGKAPREGAKGAKLGKAFFPLRPSPLRGKFPNRTTTKIPEGGEMIPGGWRFDPGQHVPGPDSLPMAAAMPLAPSASTIAMNTALNSPTTSTPRWPSMPSMPPMPWPYPPAMTTPAVPAPSNHDGMTAPSAAALQTSDPTDSDVAASLAETRAAQAMFPPVPPAPPSPASVYPAPCATSAAASGVSYRCDGYRRVARAKP